MRFEEIQKFLDHIPYNAEMRATSTVPERGRVIYQHIRQHRPLNVLELGIGHGVGSCYMAAALHENHAGHLTCVDLVDAPYSPSAEELLNQAKLTPYRLQKISKFNKLLHHYMNFQHALYVLREWMLLLQDCSQYYVNTHFTVIV